jgi:hypothetical protein
MLGFDEIHQVMCHDIYHVTLLHMVALMLLQVAEAHMSASTAALWHCQGVGIVFHRVYGDDSWRSCMTQACGAAAAEHGLDA